MKRLAILIIGLAIASFPVAALAQMVTVNGQPLYLNPGPIERAGRVLVPLRGIFERLGASVVYSAGTINATKGGTTVSLRIGSTQAEVSGEPTVIDVPPFIVGATTYVPLRFIAQSLGATVGYDAATHIVAIVMSGEMVPVGPVRPPRPPRPPNPPPMPVVNLYAQQPATGERVANRFVMISAQFTHRAEPGSVRVLLDGNNITSRSGVSATGFSYKPPAPLDFGSHTVRVAGIGWAGGSPFDRSWSFVVRGSAQPPLSVTINQPAANAPVGRNFTIQGTTVANGHVRVTAGATPSFTGQFNGNTDAGPRGNFRISVSLSTMPGQQAVSVRITVTDPATSRSTETTLQLRLNR
jgi:hypothetical protein